MDNLYDEATNVSKCKHGIIKTLNKVDKKFWIVNVWVEKFFLSQPKIGK